MPCPGAGPRGRQELFVGGNSTGIERKAGQTTAWGQEAGCPPGRTGDGRGGQGRARGQGVGTGRSPL